MSKEVKDTNKSEMTKEMKTKFLISGLLHVLVGLLIGLLIMSIANKEDKPVDSSNTTIESNESTETETGEGITTYLYEHEIFEGEQLDNACSDLIERIDSIRNNNSYFQVQVDSSSFDTYIYNKKGECFAQSSSGAFTAVTRSDGSSVKLDAMGGNVIIENDLDVLSLLRNIVTLAKDNEENVDFYNMILSEDNGTVEYRIDMIGADVFKKAYSMFNEELGNVMLESLSVQMEEGWEPHFIYTFILSENDMVVYCYLVDNNTEYLNWASQGFITLGDWELSEDWYSINIDNADYETTYMMLDTLLVELENLIQQYALDNGLVTQEELDNANNETTETVSENETTQVESESTSSEN